MVPAFFALAFVGPGQAPPPGFVVESVRGERPSGVIAKLASDGTVQFLEGPPIPGAEIVTLRRPGAPPRLPHDRPHLLFANGDRIPGRLVSIEKERVRFAADLGTASELTVPLSAMAAIWLSPRAAARAADPDGRRTLGSPRRQDVVQLANGDTFLGTIVSFSADGPLRLEVGGQTVNVPRDRLDALLFNSELARVARPREPFRRLTLQNGTRLSLSKASADAETLTGTTLFGEIVRVPWAEVATLSTFGGPAAYLSDLKPLSYEPKPFLGVRWPVAADHSVAGGDLRLGGGTFDKGLGLHSACTVTYGVPPKCGRFEALIGLDEETGRRGSVTAQIRADGRPLLHPLLELGGSDPPRELRLALPGETKELTIEIGFGRGGDIQDHVNLVEARFIVER
jgi:NPCBM/NEW2 domain